MPLSIAWHILCECKVTFKMIKTNLCLLLKSEGDGVGMGCGGSVLTSVLLLSTSKTLNIKKTDDIQPPNAPAEQTSGPPLASFFLPQPSSKAH